MTIDITKKSTRVAVQAFPEVKVSWRQPGDFDRYAPNKMRFQDPLEITCSACGRMAIVHVRPLLKLEATCPVCRKSLDDIGHSMRTNCDKAATFLDSVQIIMQIEDDQGLMIPDAVLEEIKPWEKLKIRDLVDATRHCLACRTLSGTT